MNAANTFIATGVPQTQAIAAALARQCRRGDCILLKGDLGSGKTTFARGFIQALQKTPDEVVSPTFTLVQTYPAKSGDTIWHFDLYRLKNSSELAEIGLEDAFLEGITLIEWPEIIQDSGMQSRLPESVLHVNIEIADSPDRRKLTFKGPVAWQKRLETLKENV
jgi:tRNA threonylcarbamoyladenosine biosynthesis protein TsaE